MFDRFTDRARKAMGHAREAAQRFRHDYIGTEHILIGLLRTDGAGLGVLERLGVDVKRLRARVEAHMTPGRDPMPLGQVPFTPLGKRVLESTFEEATRLGHKDLGTEHLLLGLVAERSGVAGRLLREDGITSVTARRALLEMRGEPPPELCANLEIKAACGDLAKARAAALAHGATSEGTLAQEDIYYGAQTGRLKLRRIAGKPAELIWYDRSDTAQARRSDYEVVPVTDPGALDRALRFAIGVRTVIRKTRELLLWENVRIHLDTVEGLGTFVEFEAVLGPDADEELSRNRLVLLRAALGIRDEDLVAGSYGDM